MPRIVFKNGRQRVFLERACNSLSLSWAKMSRVCGVCERTIRDWRREKHNMSYKAAIALCKKSVGSLPGDIKILPDYWNMRNIASIGAKKRYELYGNPGTLEGRKKGGMLSQKSHPVVKDIKKPKNSPALAEFIGILLGDGGLTNYQVTVSFNRETDKEHSVYIKKLIKQLFNLSSSITSNNPNHDKADRIVVSSKKLIKFLAKKGLKPGNKMYNRIDIPSWIRSKKEYKIACLRGLVDTDGSFYSYRHRVRGKVYNNFAMCFTSHSRKMIKSVGDILKELGLKPSLSYNHVYLHREIEIDAYFNIVDSSNPKHRNKYNRLIRRVA